MKEKANRIKPETGATLKEIQKASERTGIPADSFIKALDSINALDPEFLKEIQKIAIEKAKDAYHSSPEDSEAQQAALAKWSELSLKKVNEASSVLEAENAYDCAPEDSEAQEAALVKWISLCQTIEEVENAYDCASEGSEAEQAALIKIFNLVNNK